MTHTCLSFRSGYSANPAKKGADLPPEEPLFGPWDKPKDGPVANEEPLFGDYLDVRPPTPSPEVPLFGPWTTLRKGPAKSLQVF